jgi:hypothetical protein
MGQPTQRQKDERVTAQTDLDITSNLEFEGIHQSTIVMDDWGNEWDDEGELGGIDFRLVDGN